jgi:hypothetical protein
MAIVDTYSIGPRTERTALPSDSQWKVRLKNGPSKGQSCPHKWTLQNDGKPVIKGKGEGM